MTVVQHIYEVLRDRIQSGEALPGVHLVEADLTAEFQVSRVSVRDALRRLVADELVEFLPHRGIRVRRLSARDVEELYIVRTPMEALAARLAAEASPVSLDELRECCREGERAIADGDPRRYMQANARFHKALVSATGNRTLENVSTRLHAQTMSFQFITSMNLDRMRQSHEGHQEVLQAVEARDPDWAEAAMRRHVAGARAVVEPIASLELAEEDGPEPGAGVAAGADEPILQNSSSAHR